MEVFTIKTTKENKEKFKEFAKKSEITQTKLFENLVEYLYSSEGSKLMITILENKLNELKKNTQQIIITPEELHEQELKQKIKKQINDL